jgi:hypothetical protein
MYGMGYGWHWGVKHVLLFSCDYRGVLYYYSRYCIDFQCIISSHLYEVAFRLRRKVMCFWSLWFFGGTLSGVRDNSSGSDSGGNVGIMGVA